MKYSIEHRIVMIERRVIEASSFEDALNKAASGDFPAIEPYHMECEDVEMLGVSRYVPPVIDVPVADEPVKVQDYPVSKPKRRRGPKAYKPRKAGGYSPANMIPDRIVREIFELKGVPHKEIAKTYGVSNYTVSLIQRGLGRYGDLVNPMVKHNAESNAA